MKEQIKELRIKLDGLAQLTKELKPNKTLDMVFKNQEESIEDFLDRAEKEKLFKNFSNPKEIEKSVDSLYLAKAWLGKVLGELGNENPYGSGYKTKEDIVPTQDVANYNDKVSNHYHLDYPNMNHIEKVDWLRTETEEVIKFIESITWLEQKNSIVSKLNHLFNNTYNHLVEAKFWLGLELARVKNN